MYNQNIPGRNEAIISLVLGIVGLVASLFVNSLVGLLVGVAGLYYASRSKAMGYDDGLRLAGFVLSVVAIVLGGLFLLALRRLHHRFCGHRHVSVMPLLELLGRGVPLYGLLGVLGACLGLVCALVRCPSFGLSRDDCAYLYVFGAIGAVAGAKLLYLLPRLPQLAAELPLLWESPAAFAARWLSGGLVFYGGLFGGIAGAWLAADISGRTSAPSAPYWCRRCP